MTFASYIGNIYTQLGVIALLATAVFAWVKGGKPERLGALLLAVSLVATDLARGLAGQLMPSTILFASDVVTALGFLWIAFRYSSLWLGLAMLFSSAALALHAERLGGAGGETLRWHGMIVYLLLNNVLTYLTLLSLVAGTAASMIARRRRRAGAVKAPQPPRAAFASTTP